jgi:hypothetical protein
VPCPTAGFCVAVGNYQSGFVQSGMAETWNGQSWTTQSFPVPVDSDGWQLTGVSCASARFCEAVGGYSDEDAFANDAFAATWNGTLCVAWASGNEGSPGETMAERWNGSYLGEILRGSRSWLCVYLGRVGLDYADGPGFGRLWKPVKRVVGRRVLRKQPDVHRRGGRG